MRSSVGVGDLGRRDVRLDLLGLLGDLRGVLGCRDRHRSPSTRRADGGDGLGRRGHADGEQPDDAHDAHRERCGRDASERGAAIAAAGRRDPGRGGSGDRRGDLSSAGATMRVSPVKLNSLAAWANSSMSDADGSGSTTSSTGSARTTVSDSASARGLDQDLGLGRQDLGLAQLELVGGFGDRLADRLDDGAAACALGAVNAWARLLRRVTGAAAARAGRCASTITRGAGQRAAPRRAARHGRRGGCVPPIACAARSGRSSRHRPERRRASLGLGSSAAWGRARP